jgi:hypothetical protein
MELVHYLAGPLRKSRPKFDAWEPFRLAIRTLTGSTPKFKIAFDRRDPVRLRAIVPGTGNQTAKRRTQSNVGGK